MPQVDLSASDFHQLPDDKQAEWKEVARLHDVDPDDTFRIVVDGGYATFYRHARNERGNFYAVGDEPAERDPLTLPLRAEVPA